MMYLSGLSVFFITLHDLHDLRVLVLVQPAMLSIALLLLPDQLTPYYLLHALDGEVAQLV